MKVAHEESAAEGASGYQPSSTTQLAFPETASELPVVTNHLTSAGIPVEVASKGTSLPANDPPADGGEAKPEATGLSYPVGMAAEGATLPANAPSAGVNAAAVETTGRSYPVEIAVEERPSPAIDAPADRSEVEQ